ncbi:hypothetical protein QNZ47_004563 [Enterobacter cloacae]|nr:hypothetical protein [Enterobacter cloacae]
MAEQQEQQEQQEHRRARAQHGLHRRVRVLCRAGRYGLRMRLPVMRRRARRLKRRAQWWGLVMISRRRTVVFPVLGSLSLNGVRLWMACAALVVWGLTRV